MAAPANPLEMMLREQLGRMRGSDVLPDALIDAVLETVDVDGAEPVEILRPRDWDELRHQEGGDGHTAPFWARLWPSGRALADAVAARAPSLDDTRVLELGCGLALPSVVAARAGARVTVTDGSTDAAVYAAHNLALADLEGQVAVVDWREPGALLDGAPWDLVLAADVFYTRQNVEALVDLLPKLIGATGEAIVADPSRAGGRDFVAVARRVFRLETTEDPRRERVLVHTLRPR